MTTGLKLESRVRPLKGLSASYLGFLSKAGGPASSLQDFFHKDRRLVQVARGAALGLDVTPN